MEYKYTFEKDTFCFLFVENQRRQTMWFNPNLGGGNFTAPVGFPLITQKRQKL